MSKALTPDRQSYNWFMDALTSYVASYDTNTAAAHDLGITKAYLSDLLRERRFPGESILALFGMKPVRTLRYVRIK